MTQIKILTVDDSALSRRRFIAKPLRDAGYEVVEAASGVEGLKVASEEQPDIVLSDLLMPEMDGFEFVEKLKATGFAGPVMVLSADIQESSQQRVQELGAFAFINKPIKPEALLAEVRAAEETLTAGV